MLPFLPVRYKLTEGELRSLVGDGLVAPAQVQEIVAAGLARTPGQHAEHVVKFALNGPGTIVLQSIRFYGGDNFGQPYHFLAEVLSFTTRSVFARFLNAHHLRWLTRRVPFTY